MTTDDYPDPTPKMLDNDPLFDAIWSAIKGWDISRHNDGLYSGPTGNDARHIYDAIKIALLKEEQKLHDERADHLEHQLAQKDAEIEEWKVLRFNTGEKWANAENLLAQAVAALERAVLMLSIMKDAGEFQCSDTLKDCREALAAIAAQSHPREHPGAEPDPQ